MSSVVVTGVSSGIGLASARALIAHGLHVFGSVRREQDAQRLAGELGENFTPLQFDVTDAPAVQRAAARVAQRLQGATLAGLVNNAGVAVPAPLMHQPIDDFRRQLEVNLVSVLAVTQAFLPLLGTDRTRSGAPGRIVNISSVGGRLGAPFIGAYVASKHGLEGMSESLRRELMLYGIDVLLVAPGAVRTAIWDKAAAIDISAYATSGYAEVLPRFRDYFIKEGRAGLPPERIADAVLHALTSPRPKLRYAVVPKKLINWTVPMALPRRWVDRIIAGQLGLKR